MSPLQFFIGSTIDTLTIKQLMKSMPVVVSSWLDINYRLKSRMKTLRGSMSPFMILLIIHMNLIKDTQSIRLLEHCL